MYLRCWKRVMDIILSSAGLLVFAVPMLITAAAVRLSSPGPVIFTQKRVGIHKKHFCLYKFRSMRTDTPDIATYLLEDPDKYITGVGHFIRRTSLDELPQLWNIFRGDMSVVGPRPALWNQYDLIAERDMYGANDVMPGLTGWAQVNGRDELDIYEKSKLDGEYVQKVSFAFDLKCVLRTILPVLKGDGIVEGPLEAVKKSPDR